MAVVAVWTATADSVRTVVGRAGGQPGASTDLMHVRHGAPGGGWLQVYMIINMGVVAYIVGTITLVVTKQDEAAGQRRALMRNLKTFAQLNSLDAAAGGGRLLREMQAHLDLHLEHEQARPTPTPSHMYACMRLRTVNSTTGRRVTHPYTHMHAWACAMNSTTSRSVVAPHRCVMCTCAAC